jgi:hypothetical protein
MFFHCSFSTGNTVEIFLLTFSGNGRNLSTLAILFLLVVLLTMLLHHPGK